MTLDLGRWLPCGVLEWPHGWLRLWPGGPGVGWTNRPPLYSERMHPEWVLFTVRGVRVRRVAR